MDTNVHSGSRFRTLSFISPKLSFRIPRSYSCDDAVDQEVTCKGTQYDDEKVSDMCGGYKEFFTVQNALKVRGLEG